MQHKPTHTESAYAQISFTFSAYCKDKAGCIAAGLVCCGALYGMLRIMSLGHNQALAASVWVAFVLVALLVYGYVRRRAFYRRLGETVVQLERAYYLGSLVDEPAFLDGRLALALCQDICASCATDITTIRNIAATSDEFTELWIHEIKTPIAAARLTLARMHSPEAVLVRKELERIELSCDQVLFNARGTSLSEDYRICETSLLQLCQTSTKNLTNLLVEAKVAVEFDVDAGTRVLTDASWVQFVLRQVISNSAKYGASKLSFLAYEQAESEGVESATVLCVCDDGCGIPADELAHVFEHGYSGTNGRSEGKSTGFGLFLAAKTCARLGLGLSIESKQAPATGDASSASDLSAPTRCDVSGAPDAPDALDALTSSFPQVAHWHGTKVFISFPHNRQALNLTNL